jgi:hypothetical protein
MTTRHRMPLWPLFLALALLLLPGTAAAKKFRGTGGFSIKAPSGWKLKRSGGAYRLSCGNASVAFSRYKTTRTPAFVGDGATKLLGLPVVTRKATAKSFTAKLKGSVKGKTSEQAIAIRKTGSILVARRWGYGGSGKKCKVRGLRAASLLGDLAAIANSAGGGLAGSLQIKRQEFVENPAQPLRRFEGSYRDSSTGTQKFVSALIPESWAPTASIGEGAISATSPAGARDQGALALGIPYAVFQPTCIGAVMFGEGPSAGMASAPYPTSPEAAIVNDFGAIYRAKGLQVDNVRLVQKLSNDDWGGLGPSLPSQLWFIRFTFGGKPWNAIMSSAPLNNVPDACFWVWYSSFIAVADDASPGLGRALVQSWASWTISFQSKEQNVDQIANTLSPDQATDFRERLGQTFVPELGGWI